MQLFGLAASPTAIYGWIQSGGFEADLGSLHYRAAQASYEKTKLLENPSLQLSRVISHLEVADCALFACLAKTTKCELTRPRIGQVLRRPFTYAENVHTLFKGRMLMAACHASVPGEEPLAWKVFESRKECYTLGDESESMLLALGVVAYVPGAEVVAGIDWVRRQFGEHHDPETPMLGMFGKDLEPKAEVVRQSLEAKIGPAPPALEAGK